MIQHTHIHIKAHRYSLCFSLFLAFVISISQLWVFFYFCLFLLVVGVIETFEFGWCHRKVCNRITLCIVCDVAVHEWNHYQNFHTNYPLLLYSLLLSALGIACSMSWTIISSSCTNCLEASGNTNWSSIGKFQESFLKPISLKFPYTRLLSKKKFLNVTFIDIFQRLN